MGKISEKIIRIALVQMRVGLDRKENVQKAAQKIESIVKKSNPKIVVLPEGFTSPYGKKFIKENAELIPDGYTSSILSQLAKKYHICLIGGSIPEKDPENSKIFYNTCSIWSPNGSLVAKHRKIHLCDFDIPKDLTFKESDIFNSGNALTIVNFGYAKIGIGICYDIRFEEMARLYRNQGCNILIYPTSFNFSKNYLSSGLLQRARALDNQCFVATVSPVKDEVANYWSNDHSMILDPLTNVLDHGNNDETPIVADLDLSICDEVRTQFPLFSQRKTDLYDTILKN